jgi:hypothetical protein
VSTGESPCAKIGLDLRFIKFPLRCSHFYHSDTSLLA